MNGNDSDRVKFGPFEADLHTHELWKFGTRIKLVGQPFEILAILLSKPGELVTREELRDRLWPGDTFVDFSHGLNAAVNRLREALSDSADTPRYVETLPRRGYRFIAPVERQNSNQVAPEAAAPIVHTAAVPAELPPPVQPSKTKTPDNEVAASKVGGRRLSFLGACVLLALILGGMFLSKKVLSREETGNTSMAWKRIRPLTSLTDETNQPAFSPDGNSVAFRRAGSKPENSGIFVKGIVSDQLIQLTKNAGDGFPVWSPDGHSIAFSRSVSESNDAFGIYVVPLARGQMHIQYKNDQTLTLTPTIGGEEEHKLDTAGVSPTRGELDWSPDGKTIAFVSGASIFLLSLENHAVHRLTEPPPFSEDWGPTFSPDGHEILFVRSHKTASPQEIMAISTAGGEVTQITSEPAGILSPPRWSFDGRSVIFGSARGSHPGLWRTSLDVRDSPVEINDGGWYPAISRKGYRLAYQRMSRGLNIWEMECSSPANMRHILVPSTSQTDQGPGPQFSPDGKKLAYMSDRSGTMEIWVSDRDGGNPFQLTAIGSAGTPRWSPDSQSIAFDSRGAVYAVTLQKGVPRVLTPDGSENCCPSWSPDCKWIYFASTRTHEFQVWKVPADGGSPVQVTTQGGHAPQASPDGKYVYYAKTQYANPEVWQVPIDGGTEKLISPLVRPATWASWQVVDHGIIFAGPSGTGRPVLNIFTFGTNSVANLGMLDTVPFWLGATRDGKSVVFDQPGSEQDQVMLVENFR